MTDDSLSSNDAVTLTMDGDVAVIDVDDGKANALSFAVIDGLNASLDAAATSGAKAVAVIGRPGKFSAGFDLSVMTGEPAEAARLLGAGATLGLRLLMSDLPVVLGITGHALAMGGILLTCADWRVAGDGAFKLGLNEVAIGMPVPVFGVELCRARLTPRWFERCIGQAELCNPGQAVEAGFADQLVELEAVREVALAKAAAFASTLHPAAFRMTRTNCRGALAERLAASLAQDQALFNVAR